MDLDAILRRAVELGATDIHLKEGQPPILRRDGDLGADGRRAAARARRPRGRARGRVRRCRRRGSRLPEHRRPRHRVHSRRAAALPRQRASASAARSRSPSASSRSTCRPSTELDLPPGVARLAEEHRGLVLVTGATGSGKTTTLAAMIDHINRTRQQHIVTIEDPIEILHADQRLHRQPARGRARHRVVRAGAPACAAPGPRRDPDRRAPRRRDRADRAPGGRVGPPRPLDAAHGRRRRDDRPHDRVLPGREAAADPLDPGRRPARRRQPAAPPEASTAAGSPRSR